MIRCDLHVHSKFSDHPTEWFLQRLGTSESYTEPEEIYQTAKRRGMDYVTITDHNRISGALQLMESHPHDCFMGVETTAYFPEDRCKVHILIYDFNASEFDDIQYLRKDIYQLRDFIRAKDLPYSVAHATYSFNNSVTADHLEKLILLFDVFETINGGRNARTNESLAELLQTLNEVDIEKLYAKHRIETFGRTSWIKGETAGSDDHAGLFIGKTYVASDANTLAGFMDALHQGRVRPEGRTHDHSSMAFAIYKIAYDFARNKQRTIISPPVSLLTEVAFTKRKIKLYKDVIMQLAAILPGKKSDVRRSLWGVVKEIRNIQFDEIDKKIDVLYDEVSDLTDSLIRSLVDETSSVLQNGDISGLVRSVSTSLPVLFLSTPFLSTFFNMYVNRDLTQSVRNGLGKEQINTAKRILWFTDTISDLNGVAYSLREIASVAKRRGRQLLIAACMTKEEARRDNPENIMNLPIVKAVPLPGYEHLQIRIPSILQTLKRVSDYDPDEIYVSSPSTVGLVGLLVARLLKVKCVGVYHTDFTLQARDVVNDATITQFIENYMKWFYSGCARILINTRAYFDLLVERGYDRSKMKFFHRGIDTTRFRPISGARRMLSEKWKVAEGTRLLYAGRISKDKNIDLLLKAFNEASQKNSSNRLVLAGDGPDLPRLKGQYRGARNVIFVGRIDHDEMPILYSGVDYFVFPSETDTFGRVVIEAGACGTPAVVGPVGGPQELVVHDRTGWIVSERSTEAWARKLVEVVGLGSNDPKRVEEMRRAARRHVCARYSVEHMVSRLFSDNEETGSEETVSEETTTSEVRTDTMPVS